MYATVASSFISITSRNGTTMSLFYYMIAVKYSKKYKESEIYFIIVKAVSHTHLQVITLLYGSEKCVCHPYTQHIEQVVSVEIGKLFNKNFLSSPRHAKT